MAKRVFCAVLVFLGLAAAILGLAAVVSPFSETIQGLNFWSNPDSKPFYQRWTDLEKTCAQKDSGLMSYISSSKSEESGYLTSGICAIYRTWHGPPIFDIGYISGRLKYYVGYFMGQKAEEKAFDTGLSVLDSALNYVWGINAESIIKAGRKSAAIIGNFLVYDVGKYIVMDIGYYYTEKVYLCVTGIVGWFAAGAGSIFTLLSMLSEIVLGFLVEMVVYAMLTFHFTDVAALTAGAAVTWMAINFFRNRFRGLVRHIELALKEPAVKQKALITLIAAKYVAVKLITSNANFHTFHVTSKLNNKDVFLKCLRKTASKSARNIIAKEYHRTKVVHHPNIVRFVDYLQVGNSCSLGLEFARYGSLKEAMLAKVSTMRCFQKFNIFRQIVSAIEFLHATGYAHLNIRPGTVMVFNPWAVVKLSGFDQLMKIDKKSICHLFNLHPISIPGEVRNRKPYDPVKADIWALGSLFFFVVTGDYLQKDVNVCIQKAVAPHLNGCDDSEKRGVVQILTNLLNVDPQRRPEARQVRAKCKFFGQ